MVIRLLYPSLSTDIPIAWRQNKMPKLQYLDTGMVNYATDLQKEVFQSKDINSVYRGKIAEHIVAQELIASNIAKEKKLHFWIREKKQSTAEVDFVIPFDKFVIPLEVKSGKTGRLRSLHQFMDMANHKFAVRLYAGPVSIENAKTINGKKFKLLSLPYFLTGRLTDYLDWFVSTA